LGSSCNALPTVVHGSLHGAAHAARSNSLLRHQSLQRQASVAVAVGALIRANSRRLSKAGSGRAVVLAAAAAAAAAAAVSATRHQAAAAGAQRHNNSIPSSWTQTTPAEVKLYAEWLFSRISLPINMSCQSYTDMSAMQAACLVLGYKWVLRQEDVHAARVFDRCMRRAGLRGEFDLIDVELRVMEAAGWRLWMD
jgi:hypothetical protein